jgi:hypothetical protein
MHMKSPEEKFLPFSGGAGTVSGIRYAVEG